jgi:hypothetical protein
MGSGRDALVFPDSDAISQNPHFHFQMSSNWDLQDRAPGGRMKRETFAPAKENCGVTSQGARVRLRRPAGESDSNDSALEFRIQPRVSLASESRTRATQGGRGQDPLLVNKTETKDPRQ